MGITGLKVIGGFGVFWALAKTFLEWTGQMHLLHSSVRTSAAWIADLYGVLSAPSPSSTAAIFSASAGLVGLLVFVEKRKGRNGRSTIGVSSEEHEDAPLEAEKSSICGFSKGSDHRRRFREEWERLEESDREIIREIVLKGGLMESDITAVLRARGFIQYDAAYEPITDRVSFIQCDYTGYHSIMRSFHAWVSEKIREELRDESFSNEIRYTV